MSKRAGTFFKKVYVSLIDRDTGETIIESRRLLGNKEFNSLSKKFKELPIKILIDKLDQFEYWEKRYVFFAIMRIIKEDGDFELFSILDAFNKLDKMVKQNHPDLPRYFIEPIDEMEIAEGKVGTVFFCDIRFEGFLSSATFSVVYNVTKNEGFIQYI